MYLKKSSKYRYRHIPVIVLSTSSDKTTIEKAYENGIDSFITKSVSYEGFVEKLEILQEYC